MTTTHRTRGSHHRWPLATEPSPATIMQLASGFMAAKHLFAANELGLFEALADSPADLDALAARTGLTRRAARISADAMVALGLLELQDGTYRNGEAATRFLAGPGPGDLRPVPEVLGQDQLPGLDEAGRGPRQRSAAGDLRAR
jgi:hypothetical protein